LSDAYGRKLDLPFTYHYVSLYSQQHAEHFITTNRQFPGASVRSELPLDHRKLREVIDLSIVIEKQTFRTSRFVKILEDNCCELVVRLL
jgi:hypothetical protein